MATLEQQLAASVHWARSKRLERETMTEAIQRHEEIAAHIGSELATWRAMREQANELVKSGFLPRAINTPEKAMAVIQTGKELGLGPMQSLRSIHIIEGKPTMSADLIAGLALAKVPGSVLRVAETTNKVCVIKAARQGQELTTFRYTWEDAQQAGLVGKQNWKNYPRAMLRARAITEAARAIFPDAVMGLYDPDEVGAVTTATGELVAEVTQISAHVAPDEDPNASGDEDLFRHLCGRFSTIESSIEACDSWDKACALRGLLGTRAAQSDLTRTMQQRAEAGDISPSQRQELGKTWMRCNRRLEKLEEKLKPALEATFADAPEDETTDAFSPTRQPGEDDD